MSSAAPKQRLRKRALELGFAQFGVAPAEKPDHTEWFREWLARGWHGEMGYLAREDAVRRRLSPAEALPGCRSILVVSRAYGNAPAESAPRPEAAGPRSALVARYALGRDYHDVFEERLGKLAETVRQIDPDAKVKPYVDYGPVLEREHAQRSGLGWIGKNTLLIHPDLGSYLLLGELLTTLELEPDEPFTTDRCGSCTRCIAACPTDAIRGPRELDARRCISYLTIELRGAIPRELRPLVGNRVFGCDICQEVCPWNAAAREETGEGRSVGGRPPPSFGTPVPPEDMVAWAEELLDLDPAGFRERYRRTALERPGRAGLLRNLCVGLGNSGDPEAAAPLCRALEDVEPLVRAHAAWALGRLGVPAARAALSARLRVESDDGVREELEAALAG